MADEHQFIEDGLQRSQIDEFFAEELGRAGYGGMDVAKTPMGTQIVLKAEKPGMVIGKGGKNIRKITRELGERFNLDDPQIDVQEVDEPDLNARIVADRLANALERGWYFRKAGHTTIDRIMDSGALGAEIVLSGKVTGARSRVEKFNRGYIKHNGEPAQTIVDHGQGVAVMKLGTIGVTVKIIPPGADLPDDFQIDEGANPEDSFPKRSRPTRPPTSSKNRRGRTRRPPRRRGPRNRRNPARPTSTKKSSRKSSRTSPKLTPTNPKPSPSRKNSTNSKRTSRRKPRNSSKRWRRGAGSSERGSGATSSTEERKPTEEEDEE